MILLTVEIAEAPVKVAKFALMANASFPVKMDLLIARELVSIPNPIVSTVVNVDRLVLLERFVSRVNVSFPVSKDLLNAVPSA